VALASNFGLDVEAGGCCEQSKHSTDVESTEPSPRVCRVSIHTDGKSCSDLGSISMRVLVVTRCETTQCSLIHLANTPKHTSLDPAKPPQPPRHPGAKRPNVHPVHLANTPKHTSLTLLRGDPGGREAAGVPRQPGAVRGVPRAPRQWHRLQLRGDRYPVPPFQRGRRQSFSHSLTRFFPESTAEYHTSEMLRSSCYRNGWSGRGLRMRRVCTGTPVQYEQTDSEGVEGPAGGR